MRIPRPWEPGFQEHIAFFQAFLREPASVGAVSPSSPALARAMIEGFRLDRAETVVELGPGTGAFTGLIREAVGRRSTFLTIELDPGNVETLKKRFPGVIVHHDSAENLRACLARHKKTQADYVISGLPWASLPLAVQEGVFKAILASLAPEGVFTTFGYLHARYCSKARQFRQRLEQHFEKVETSPVVWWNLPPAFVYRCSGRRLAAGAG